MTIEDLGRRAVACKHWRWMPGMLASNGEEYVRVFYVSANHLHLIEFEDDEFGMVRIPKDTCLIPDLSDPATLGCLLALVREAWKGNVAPVYPDSDEAVTKLVAALEAAP